MSAHCLAPIICYYCNKCANTFTTRSNTNPRAGNNWQWFQLVLRAELFLQLSADTGNSETAFERAWVGAKRWDSTHHAHPSPTQAEATLTCRHCGGQLAMPPTGAVHRHILWRGTERLARLDPPQSFWEFWTLRTLRLSSAETSNARGLAVSAGKIHTPMPQSVCTGVPCGILRKGLHARVLDLAHLLSTCACQCANRARIGCVQLNTSARITNQP
jgi:hypothetical protein